MDPVITDLVQIRRLGEKKHDENLRFRRWIKSHNYVERQFKRAAEEVHEAIDCRQCAECCRTPEVELTDRDIEHLMKHLRVSRKHFLSDYTELNDEDKPILKKVAGACVFLSGNDCTVYEARPGDCERFPHLLRGQGSIPSRMWTLVDRASYCPIVYNWFERIKTLTNFRPSSQ